MISAVLPVGRYLGDFYSSPNSEEPDIYEALIGDDTFQMSRDQYRVWIAAHGAYKQGEPAPPQTRATVEKVARDLGAEDSEVSYKELKEAGLLTQVVPQGRALGQFAREYRVEPLMVGLGNSPDRLEMMQIGVPGMTRALVSYEAYRVWAFASEYPSLWDTCVKVAEPTGVEGLSTDPDFLLKNFFDALPALVSVNCVYINRR